MINGLYRWINQTAALHSTTTIKLYQIITFQCYNAVSSGTSRPFCTHESFRPRGGVPRADLRHPLLVLHGTVAFHPPCFDLAATKRTVAVEAVCDSELTHLGGEWTLSLEIALPKYRNLDAG